MTEKEHNHQVNTFPHVRQRVFWLSFILLGLCLGLVIFKSDFQYIWTQHRVDEVETYYNHIIKIVTPANAQLLMIDLGHGPEVAPIAPQCIFAHHILILGSNQNAETLLSEFAKTLDAIGWVKSAENCTPEGYCYHSYDDPEKKMSVTMTIWAKRTLGKYSGSAYFQWDQWHTQYKTILGLAFLYTDGCDLQ